MSVFFSLCSLYDLVIFVLYNVLYFSIATDAVFVFFLCIWLILRSTLVPVTLFFRFLTGRHLSTPCVSPFSSPFWLCLSCLVLSCLAVCLSVVFAVFLLWLFVRVFCCVVLSRRPLGLNVLI